MRRLAIIGSAKSGGAAQIIEALSSSLLYQPSLIFDRDFDLLPHGIFGVPVVGPVELLAEYWSLGEFEEAIIAIGGDLNERKRLFLHLQELGIRLANVIDPNVKTGMNVSFGQGNVILNNSYFGNNVSLGDNNYILNQCSFQHDTKIADHNYFATNVTVGAKVKIGNGNRFGIKCIIETGGIVGDTKTLPSGKLLTSMGKDFI